MSNARWNPETTTAACRFADAVYDAALDWLHDSDAAKAARETEVAATLAPLVAALPLDVVERLYSLAGDRVIAARVGAGMATVCACGHTETQHMHYSDRGPGPGACLFCDCARYARKDGGK